jgi:two-component system chemotaxis sensor kinase CheA
VSLSAEIREQLITSFRSDLDEYIQTMTDGLLALEQNRVTGEERQSTLDDVFRAAHSLKGAARVVGVTTVEQLAHALESVLDGMQRQAIQPTPDLFTACYQALDALQAVQAAYEAGETTPPVQALQALVGLEPFVSGAAAAPAQDKDSEQSPATSRQARDGADSEQGACPQDTLVLEESQKDQDALVPALGPEGPAPAPAIPARTAEETIRVSVTKLDALMAQLSELLVTKIRAEQRLVQVCQFQEYITQWQKEWLDVRSAYGRLARRSQDVRDALGLPAPSRWPEVRPPSAVKLWGGGELLPQDDAPGAATGNNGLGRFARDLVHLLNYVDASQERLREMQTMINDLSRQYTSDTMNMSLVIDELEGEIKRVRMLPLSTITGPFGRMVRDLTREASKEAVLEIVGGETELDKRVLEQIKDPLIHLLRNAVDHGIERPAQREAAGKPRVGTITLTAQQLDKDVAIRVSDDGAGLDLEAIRQAVARRGGLDAQLLSEAELVDAIFNAGVSTSSIITDISGRGVGLDVVRRNAEALQGRIGVDWTPGGGTTFVLTLPLTLTSSRGLLVRVVDQLFAIPLNAIDKIIEVGPDEISPLEGRDTVRHNGRPIRLVWLGDVLELAGPRVQRDNDRIPVVILASAERRTAFAVDELAGEQEVVIKELGKQLSRVGGIAGATVMGSGEIVLILNVADLIKLAMRSERRLVLDTLVETDSPAATRAQRRILVVDDSLTTRTLEKSILEAAGYAVRLATDGKEALDAIASDGVPDLIVSDIAMPRIDGFDLTRRIKEDAHTTEVPVILVTSLDSPEDKARGIAVGADAYIIKSSFDQNNLLETIEQLVC